MAKVMNVKVEIKYAGGDAPYGSSKVTARVYKSRSAAHTQRQIEQEFREAYPTRTIVEVRLLAAWQI